MEIAQKEVYHDNLFDRLFIWLFVRKMAIALGKNTKLKGYEGVVDLSKQIMQNRNAREQQEAVADVLKSLIPNWVLAAIRTIFSPTKLVCELNATFAKLLFTWLVGPCEVTEVEVVGEDGKFRKQNSGVHIKKCRYLEHSQCVGMCVNMCKLPTQEFFTKEFGFPLTMTPHFEDLSCDMIFGQLPLSLEEDPAYNEPCLATRCELPKPKAKSCPKVREY